MELTTELKVYLRGLQELVKALNDTNSRNEKQAILKASGEPYKAILKHVYDDFITHGITSKLLGKQREGNSLWVEECSTHHIDDMFNALGDLASRKLTGGKAVGTWGNFIVNHPEYAELLTNILDKDLRCRIGAKDINSVFPNLIPEFNVALAEKFGDGKNSELIKKGSWFISTKLDGVRLIAIKKGEDIKFYSRSGNEYLTLEAYKQEILDSFGIHSELVLDGELIMKTGDSDDFRAVMKQVTRKDYQIDNLTYSIFDCLTLDEFFSGTSQRKLGERLDDLGHLTNNNEFKSSNKLEVLNQVKYTEEEFEAMVTKVHEFDWEGLIFRKDEVYKGKRSKDILKWKEFFDDEYVVVGTENTTKQIIIDGQNQIVDVMGSAQIEHKGYPVSVGSGWSDEQRIEFAKDPSQIIGKVITVKYKKESHDENGNLSLQFPVVKVIHGEKRTT